MNAEAPGSLNTSYVRYSRNSMCLLTMVVTLIGVTLAVEGRADAWILFAMALLGGAEWIGATSLVRFTEEGVEIRDIGRWKLTRWSQIADVRMGGCSLPPGEAPVLLVRKEEDATRVDARPRRVPIYALATPIYLKGLQTRKESRRVQEEALREIRSKLRQLEVSP